MKWVIDSSAWIELLTEGPKAKEVAVTIEAADALVVPAAVLAEVHHWLLQETDPARALVAVASLRQGEMVPVDESLAMKSAELAHDQGIGVIQAMVVATARQRNARVLSMDPALARLAEVEWIVPGKKKKKDKA